MLSLVAKIRPQILLVICALVVISFLVLSGDNLSAEVKGTIIGTAVGGIIMIGKDLILLDSDKSD